MKFAFIFPGQGSQAIGMLSELSSNYPIVKQTFEEASEILDYDLWKLTQEGPKENLNQTDKTQPALLAAGISIWRVWQQQGGKNPELMAGHSFGEYTALVCAGALKFTDTVSLAESRGRFMQTAVPEGEGAMAAILGLADEAIIKACDEAAQDQVVTAVNFNAPGQVVIAGNTDAVKRAITQAKEAGAKKAILLAVSVPSHSSLMQPAADKMKERLTEVEIVSPTIPVIHNVDVIIKTEPDAIRAALVAQLHNPVRWVETINKIADAGVGLLFESGPDKVLTGLNKRINKNMTAKPIIDLKTLEQALETLG
ncbi:ACP S-malonyltransferase [Candidatus Halobeggiatoa sp. HSG11]|nr:ACP S-malonyltransferase [Candidatus Halobeggiatoa sp. HSG11]